MAEFSKDFLWGAASSSFQVEGNNTNSDWWEWEIKNSRKELSGSACRHYEQFREDFSLAKQLNHNSHRLSIEWSRVEPEEGKFSLKEIEHYKEVILALKEFGLEPIITLHHFTNPAWFSAKGGWLNKSAQKYFIRYCEKIVPHLAKEVRFWVTINEPNVYAYQSYVIGAWPPQERSFSKAKKVSKALALSHIKAYKLIHAIYKKEDLPAPMISIAANLQDFQACRPSLRNKLAVYLRNRYYNWSIIKKLIRHRTLDFIGVNYYTRSLIEVRGWRPRNILLDECIDGHFKVKKNCLGWDIYPQGLYNLLLKLKRFKKPVFILENGVCTEDDSLRWDFIFEHLKSLKKAIDEGVKCLGYIYWSLIDNYEWDKGFSPRFGLVEVDYTTFKRNIRESAKKFSLICKTGKVS